MIDEREASKIAKKSYTSWTNHRMADDPSWENLEPHVRSIWLQVAGMLHTERFLNVSPITCRSRMSIKLPDINNSGHKDLFIGSRSRLSSCTSVKFIDESRLVAASLCGQRLYLIRYDLSVSTYEILDCVPTQSGGKDVCTDLLDFDGSDMLATSNCNDGSATLYKLAGDRITHHKDVFLPNGLNGWSHGVRFVPGYSDLICMCLSKGNCSSYFISLEDGNIHYQIEDEKWRVKDVCFIARGRMVILYSYGTPSRKAAVPYGSKASLLAFDLAERSHKVLDEVILEGSHVDACGLYEGRVFVTNSSRGSIMAIGVDGGTITLEGELADFEVPHGIDFLRERQLIGVTDYVKNSVELSVFVSNI